MLGKLLAFVVVLIARVVCVVFVFCVRVVACTRVCFCGVVVVHVAQCLSGWHVVC